MKRPPQRGSEMAANHINLKKEIIEFTHKTEKIKVAE